MTLIERFQHLLDWPHAYWLLFVISILESLILPVPLEAILIPWMLARPKTGLKLAAVTVAGNLVGASIGYLLSVWAVDDIRPWLFSTISGAQQGYADFQQRFEQHGFLAIAIVGFSPIPFQFAMIGAGATGYSFVLYLLACFVGRGLRYFGLALLIWWGGEKALNVWHRHARIIVALALVALGGWLLWSWLSH